MLMNANFDKLERSYPAELSEFAEQLQEQIADESLLDDIHSAVQALLSGNGNIEADIRRILQEQRRAGNLRDETFELAQRMLDRATHEDPAPAPMVSEFDAQNDDPFRDTTVIATSTSDAESADDRCQVGSVLRDRFLLQERIAGGSMGVVYKALDRRLAEVDGVDPWVAIKVLTPQLARNAQALRALQQEAAKGRCLLHPNIVRFLDFDRDEDLYFIVMEWLDGKSLGSILDDSGSKKIDKETALDVVKQVAKALDYAHRLGVVHADVKPGNILVSPDGEIKLFDFGAARVRQKRLEGQANSDAGEPGAVAPAYSSMQVLTGEEPVAADDVFSLGCLMYRLVAGYRVFGPRNAAEAADTGMEPQRPQGLNDTEWHALRKALSYSRVSRFASPKEFIEALAAPVAPKSIQVSAELDEPYDERRRVWPYVVTAVLLIVGVLGLYQSGLLDSLLARSEPVATVAADQNTIAEQAPQAEPPAGEGPVMEAPALVLDEGPRVSEFAGENVQAEEIAEQAELLYFSTLRSATVEIPLALPGAVRTEVDLTLRENGEPAIIDLVREYNIAETLVVKIEEVGFTGNRSPWESGQYQISEHSMARFLPGQDRVRFTLSMMPDSIREPDRQVSLLVRDFDNAESEFALINLSLEDDDQRRFESGLAPNTVAFAVGRVLVRERDPAVQIDVVRFNPDQTALTVEYILREVTATEGEDYFAPGTNSIQFGPGQRSARILIPLVQDSRPESDETFVLEMLVPSPETAKANIFGRIAVIIRDDDSTLE
ncbi:MAG: hypothetical protein E2O63_01615 [Gammaproteobacteria bacterium]|nr:MAG: hypothetical protein E2O63_01615 [Gammaproteobacteria bacterium]